MKNLTILFSTPDISKLIGVGSGFYEFTTRFYNNATGLPLNNPNIQNEYVQTVAPTGSNFTLVLPVVEAPYNIPNVKIKIFSNNNID